MKGKRKLVQVNLRSHEKPVTQEIRVELISVNLSNPQLRSRNPANLIKKRKKKMK